MRRFKVKSKNHIGVSYLVEVDDYGNISCDCPAPKKIDCNHKTLIRNFLSRKSVPYEELCRIEEIKC